MRGRFHTFLAATSASSAFFNGAGIRCDGPDRNPKHNECVQQQDDGESDQGVEKCAVMGAIVPVIIAKSVESIMVMILLQIGTCK